MVRLIFRTARAVAAGGLALILAWGGVVTAQAETLNAARAAVAVPAATSAAQVVDTNSTVKGSYETVQAAINAAQAGDTIEILKDTDENITLTKQLTLTSANPKNPVTLTGIVNLPYSNEASGSTIENLNFTYGSGRWFSVGIHASNVTVQNCSFTIPDNVNSGSIAIWVQQYGQVGTKIEGNTFTFDTSDFRRAVEVYGEETTDISGTKSVTVSNNTCVTTKESSDAWLLDVQGWNHGVANVQVSGNKQGAGSNAVNGVRFANVSKLSVTGNVLSGTVAESVASEKATEAEPTPKSSSITITNNTTSAIKLDSAYLNGVATVAANKTAEGGASPVSGMEASVGDTAYPTFKEAIAAANDGDTVTLLSDVKLDNPVSIGKQVSIDGQGHQLNGQLIFMTSNGGSATGSTVSNVHFLLGGDTKIGGWSSSIYIDGGANNLKISGNHFTVQSDATAKAGKAMAIYVFPSRNTSVNGTQIVNNTFDIQPRSGASNIGVNLSSEIGEKITDTVISGNTVVGHPTAKGEEIFLMTYDKGGKQGVDGLTVSNNTFEKGATASGTMLKFTGGTQNVTISGNTFGAGSKAVEFSSMGYGNTPSPNSTFDIKGNTFNVPYAVIESGAGIERGTLTYDKYFASSTDGNTYGLNTVPYEGGTSSYGVSFYVDGTLAGFNYPASGSTVTLPSDLAVKPGYMLSDWYTDKDLTTKFDKTLVPTQVLALYSKSVAIDYSVTYDLGGGALPQGASNPGSYTVESNDITLASPVRDGYDFLGWFDANGKQVTSIAKGSTGDIELTAKWQAKTVPPAAKTWNVTFDDNISSTQNSVVKVEDGKTVARPADPTLDGWRFVGWFTNKALTAAYDFSTPVTGDLTLYGGWVKAGAAENAKPTAPKASDTSTTSGANKALPQTGDANSIVAPVVLGVAGVAALAGAVVMRRRQQ